MLGTAGVKKKKKKKLKTQTCRLVMRGKISRMSTILLFTTCSGNKLS